MKNIPQFLVPLAVAGFSMFGFGAAAQTPESVVKACASIPSAETMKKYEMASHADDAGKDQKAVSEVRAFLKLLDENETIVKNKLDALTKEGDAATKKEEEKLLKQAEKNFSSSKPVEQMSQAEIIQMGMQMQSKMSANLVAQDVVKIAALQEEMQQLSEKFVAESQRIATEEGALRAKHKAMWQKGGKYYSKFMPLQVELDAFGDGEVGSTNMPQINAIVAKMNRIREDYYTEIIPEWLKLMEKLRADEKKTMPLRERMLKASLEYATLAAKMPGIPLEALTETTAAVELKKLPWEYAEKELYTIGRYLRYESAQLVR